MPEHVSLIDIYATLRENDFPNPVAANIATATHRVLNVGKQQKAATFSDAWLRNARFVSVTLGIGAFTSAILLGLAAR